MHLRLALFAASMRITYAARATQRVCECVMWRRVVSRRIANVVLSAFHSRERRKAIAGKRKILLPLLIFDPRASRDFKSEIAAD